MTTKSYCVLAAVVFALIALLQLARAVMGWPVTVYDYVMPFWPSWIAFVVAAALSVLGFDAARRR